MGKRGRQPGYGKYTENEMVFARITPELKEKLMKISDEETISGAIRKAVDLYIENREAILWRD